jgi:hypothetical protein
MMLSQEQSPVAPVRGAITHAVRKAGPQDEDALIEQCHLLHSENGLFKIDSGLVRDLVHCSIHGSPSQTFPHLAMIGVIGEPGQLQGSICLRIAQVYYSREFLLEELWNFVHPDFRKSNNARNLIRYAKQCADALPLPLFISIVSNTRTEAKVRLYERELKKMGAYFVYTPEALRTQ